MSWQDLTRGIASEFTAASALGRAYATLPPMRLDALRRGRAVRTDVLPGCERVRDTPPTTARRPARRQ